MTSAPDDPAPDDPAPDDPAPDDPAPPQPQLGLDEPTAAPIKRPSGLGATMILGGSPEVMPEADSETLEENE